MKTACRIFSGGELQRLAIVLALGTPANVYLLDEQCAFLDSEQHLNCAKVTKRFIMQSQKNAFVVENDLVEATASPPLSRLSGLNEFLKGLQVTFRRDSVSFRPR